MIVYGIKNCDTVKKAVTWLKQNSVDFEFHDYKSKGIGTEKLEAWSKQVGWDNLLNKKGTTWRQLDAGTKDLINTEANAIALMIQKTSIIKRPLIEKEGKVILLGFDEAEYGRTLLIANK